MSYVLVVDDDADGREPLCLFLERAGHEVACASNGREALASITSRAPAVVILDLYMPEMDGARFLDVLRSYVRFQSIPVIILTAYPESSMLEQARSLNVSAILRKGKTPFAQILAAVQRALPAWIPPPPDAPPNYCDDA